MLRVLSSTDWLRSLVKQSSLWIGLYIFGYLHWDIRWLVILMIIVLIVYIKFGRYNRIKDGVHPKVVDFGGAVTAGDLPEWVLNPDSHRAEWTNVIFKHLWPHLEEFLKKTLRSVETDVQLQKRLVGYHIRSLRFPQVSLGHIPPRVNGIKVHKSVHWDEIILDVNLQYNGDLCIVMEVDIAGVPSFMPPANASIQNMAFSGTLRLHLRPLLKSLPFVGGVTVSFLEAPTLDFDLGGLASAFDKTGISLLLRHVIQDQLEQTIVMPHSVTMSFVSLDATKSLRITGSEIARKLITVPAGVLSVKLIEAKGLMNKDRMILGLGKSDPYAKVRLVSDGMVHTFKSETVPNNLDPIWNLLIDMPIDDPGSMDDIFVEIWDADRGVRDDFLGSCTIPLSTCRSSMSTGSTQDIWKELEKAEKGALHVQISWCDLKLNNPSSLDEYHKGILVVVVDSCRNLKSGITGLRLPNPAVKVELCGVSQVTDAVIGSVDPVFSHRMNFLVRDPESDTLKIFVFDSKRSSETLGYLRIDLSTLLEHPSMTVTNHPYTLVSKNGKIVESPQITLSLAFRYICRPQRQAFGSHSDLSELTKVLQPSASRLGKPMNSEFSEEPDSIPFIDEFPSLKKYDEIVDISRVKEEESTRAQNNGFKVKASNRLSFTESDHQVKKPLPLVKSQPEMRYHSFRESTRIDPSVQRLRSFRRETPDFRPKIQLTLKYSQMTMTLSVVVHKAKNIHVSSPYVKLHLLEPMGSLVYRRLAHSKRKTKVQRSKPNSPNEVLFEETLEYFVHPRDIAYRRLEMTLCSGKTMKIISRSSVIGRCLVNLDAEKLVHPTGDATSLVQWHMIGFENGKDVGNGTIPRSQSAVGSEKLSRKFIRRSNSSASLPYH